MMMMMMMTVGKDSMLTWMNSMLKCHKKKSTHMGMEMRLSMIPSVSIEPQ